MSRKPSAVQPVDLDNVLVNEIGPFGKFQAINLALIALPIISGAFMSEYIFGAAAIPHRCMIPECGEQSKGLTYEQDWASDAIPPGTNGLSRCERYARASASNGSLDFCPADLFNKDNTIQCEGYVYDRDNTVVYEFDLGCQDWMRALAGTLSSTGTLLVLPFIGYISDRFGRRVSVVISVCNIGLFGLIRAFSVNYPMYLAFQLLQTTLGAGIVSAAFIFATEMVGPKYRVLTSALCTVTFAIGQAILGSMAWAVPYWRHLLMALNIPCFLLVSYYWIIPESARWLLSKGRYDEAKELLQKMARVNNKEISEKSLNELMNPPKPIAEESKDKENLVKQIIQSPVLLRRVCTTPIWWITTTFVYYGLSINSTSLSDTMYLNYILTSLIEVPGNLSSVLIVDRIGRKPTLSGGYFVTAACNIAFAFIPRELTILRLVIYLLGKFGISLVFTCLYLYTSELYPTQYRHSLLAFSSMVGRIGSITAPLTPVLADYWPGIPTLMFGSMAMLSGLLVLTQPETLGTKLPDTLEEAEALGKSR